MVLDNGKFYKAIKLVIPEKIWAKYKRVFTNKFYSSLEDVEEFISEVVNAVTKKEDMSICGFSYFFNDIWTVL